MKLHNQNFNKKGQHVGTMLTLISREPRAMPDRFRKGYFLTKTAQVMKCKIKKQEVYAWLMKGLLLHFFLLFSVFSFAAIFPSEGQGVLQRKVSVSAENMMIKNILEKIEETASIRFAYQANQVNVNRKASIFIEDMPLGNVLTMLFDKSTLFEAKGDLVVIVPAAIDAFGIQVSGKVTDEKGLPLAGVNVAEKGTTNGTSTDADGIYSFLAEGTNAVLVFSFVGYISQEIPVGSKTIIDVLLAADQKQLEEIVVVGYGTQKKENLTSSVVTVGPEVLENRGVANISNMIAGQAPGVTVIQRGGPPGRDQGTLNIRGTSSGISGPLYVVDGVISLDYTQLNPNDIESITILKDAAATAIYGINTSSTVIVITTKRGGTGKPKFSYSTQLGTSGTINLSQKADSYQLAILHNEASDSDGLSRRFTDGDIQKFKDGSSPLTHPNSDWVKAVFSKPGIWQSHNLSMSGGTEKTKYLVSGSYLNQDGQMENTGYKHYTFRTNIDQKITERFSVSSNLALSNRTVNDPPTNQGIGGATWYLHQVFKLWANDLIRYPDGRWAEGTWSGQSYNPVAYVSKDAGYRKTSDNRLDGTFIAEYKLAKGLTIKGVANTIQGFNSTSNLGLGMDIYKRDVAPGTIAASPDNGASMPKDPAKRNVGRDFYKHYRNTLQGLINYEKKINAHEIKVLLGSELIRSSDENSGISRSILREPLGDINAADPTGQTTYGSTADYKRNSYFGRLNYIFGNRYLLEASCRIDQSSKFHLGNRTGIFPAFSAGWLVSNEEFFKVSAINLLKIRASYGVTGDEGNLGNYAYIPSYGGGSFYIFNNTRNSGVQEGALANQNIRWQSTLKKNIGIDLGFLNHKLTFIADYFVQNTNDILASIDAPAVLGSDAPQSNALSDKNQGYEIAAKYNDKAGGVNYFVNANFAFVESVITDLKGTDKPGNRVGDPRDNIFGYVAEGIFQSRDQIRSHPADQSSIGVPKPGDIIYKDLNGDGKVNEKDRTNLGTTFPSINYGLSLGADYKGFDISMLWQGAGQVKAILKGRLAQPFWLSGSSPTQAQMNRWTSDGANPNADFPITSFSRNYNYVPSTFWIKNVDYLKLRNIQLGYTLPASVSDKIGISKLRIYASGENLLRVSSFNIIDPEVLATEDPYFGYGGSGAYPTSRRVIMGLSLTF